MDAEAAFGEHRALLFTVAYEMLGSRADAKDAVQESWLRWCRADRGEIRDPRSYLVRIVTRLALDRLRSAKRERERYVGPWLPEPLVTSRDVTDDLELAESVSLAMLVVLETLAPTERAVFVLREVFGFEYEEIADAVGKSNAAVRQIAHRSRERVRERRPRLTSTPEDREAVAGRFLEAAAGGDVQALMDVLAPGVVLFTDGGGKVRAALRPIVGVDKVLRFLEGVRPEPERVRFEVAPLNGQPSLLVYLDGALDTVVTTHVEDGVVTEIYVVRNPDKLVGLHDAAARLTR